jgi:hypothetical protein
MAISTAAAIIGAAVVGAGASAISGANAAKKAANASNYAADQNAAVSREIYNQTRSDLAPYNAAGQGALTALMTRLGLTPMQAGAAGQPQVRPPQAGNPAAAAKATGGFAGTSPLAPAGPGLGSGGTAGPAPAGPAASTLLGEDGFGGGSPAPVAASGGGVDYQRLFQDRPDVMAEYQKVAGQADPNSPEFQRLGLDRGAEGFADYWLQSKPPQDTYAAPTMAPQGGQPQGPADPNAAPDQYYQDTYADRPQGMAPPSFQRQGDVQFQDYGNGPQFSYTTKDIENDPGYQFALKEGLGSVNAASAVAGRLRSGGAAKALQDRGSGVAHQFDNDFFSRAMQTYNAQRGAFQDNRNFGNDQSRYVQGRNDANFIDDRSYGTNLWNTQQNRADNIFSDDRGFAANRNDQATSNLFNLVNVGTGAAAGAANAGNTFASNTINSNNQRASNTANAAIANGANTANLFGSAANAIGTYYGMRGGGGGASMPRQYSI